MKRRLWPAVVAMAVVAAACGGSDEGEPMTISDATVIYDEYESSLMAGDARRWIGLWSDDDPVQMPPGAPALAG